MDEATKNGRLTRFSVFELDRESGELFRQGRKVKLQGQPFELLLALLERAGEVLTREELRQKVWPTDTAGDFDQGLNRAVNKVREALGDSAETPRFIETLPRRGYRFIGAIEQGNGVQPLSGPLKTPQLGEPVVGPAVPRKFWSVSVLLVGVGLMAGFLIWMALHGRVSRGELRMQQLTTNSSDNPIWQAVISPDGKYLAYGDLAGIQIRLISTGESHLMPKPQSLGPGDAWFPTA